MSRFISDQNNTAFYYESGLYASTSGVAHSVGLVQSNEPDESSNSITIRNHGTENRNISSFTLGTEDFTGTLTYFPQDWKMLGFALGSTVDSGSPSPYTHTLNEANNDQGNYATSGAELPFNSFSLTNEQIGALAGTNFTRTFKGCVINSLTMNMTQSEPISLDIDWVGQSVTFGSGAPVLPTQATTRPYIFSDLVMHLPSGTTLDQLKEATFTINNNMDPPHYLDGTRNISTPIPGNREYELTMSLDSTSVWAKTLYDQHFLGGAGSTFNMLLAITASAGSRELIMTLSGCLLMDMEAPSPNEGINEWSLTVIPEKVNGAVEDSIELYNAW